VRIEANLKRVESQVVQNSDKIRIVADESMATQRHGMMEKLHNRVVGIEEMVNKDSSAPVDIPFGILYLV
jgi:folate-dependent tRNA-U54 methylase TrmFO/GidA